MSTQDYIELEARAVKPENRELYKQVRSVIDGDETWSKVGILVTIVNRPDSTKDIMISSVDPLEKDNQETLLDFMESHFPNVSFASIGFVEEQATHDE